MAIKIDYDAGVYEIKGLLTAENCLYLENELNNFIANSRGVVLSLENLTAIDNESVKSIVAVSEKAKLNQKMFYVFGRKNNNVKKQFIAMNQNDLLI